MDRNRLVRLVGASLVLLGGAVHLKLNLDDYGTEDIARTFALNALVSALVAAYIVLRRDEVGLLAGVGVSLGTLVAFTLSRVGDGILDFREVGFNPSPDAAITVITEVGALLVLSAVLALGRRGDRSPSSSPPR